MHIEQKLWTQKDGWVLKSDALQQKPQIVFVFGGRAQVEKAEHLTSLQEMYPEAKILMCSTSGEILGTRVYDDSLSVTAVSFEKTEIKVVETTIVHSKESAQKGIDLASSLPQEGLAHVMVFSDGLTVNGTALVDGLGSALPKHVSVTGGLVGDGADFKHTVVGVNEAPKEKNIVLIGFYGTSLSIGYGSLGGWDTFGPDRTITRSKDNVLYELDGMPALDLYKEYLGELASELPGSGLLFPMRLNYQTSGGQVEVVRTLLAVDEEEKSMTFAGDMPEGVEATLMKANFDRLIDGAYGAAKMTTENSSDEPDLAILISCVGRKLVLKSRVEEETEAVQAVLGENVKMAGFYSYGEICPVAATQKQCRLHNQTMTITTFKEV
jgi:hypothetical protein